LTRASVWGAGIEVLSGAFLFSVLWSSDQYIALKQPHLLLSVIYL